MFKRLIGATSLSLIISYILSLTLMTLMLKPVIIPLMIWLGMLTTYLPFFEVKSIQDFITNNAPLIGLLVGVVGMYIFISSVYRLYKFMSLKKYAGVKKFSEVNTLKAFTIPINLILWNTLFYFGLILAIKPILMYLVLIINSATVLIANTLFSGITAETLISVNMFFLFVILSAYFFLFLYTHIKIISPLLDKLNLTIIRMTNNYEPEQNMPLLLEKVEEYLEGRRVYHVSLSHGDHMKTMIRIPASFSNFADFTLVYSSFKEFKDLYEINVKNEASLFTRQSSKQMLSQNAGVRVGFD